jgi:hypothetical protein
MAEQNTEQELRERLDIIERMIAEGRRSTESWGWTFIVWGIVYYVALAWSAWGHNHWAWPITAVIGVIVTFVGTSFSPGNRAQTALSHAILSIWIAVGISFFLLFCALGLSGRLIDEHVFMAVLSAILGMANGASALMLRWRVQLACAIVWWVAAVATCFGSDSQSTMVFLAAVFLGQILFGTYGMIAEAQTRKRHLAIHA